MEAGTAQAPSWLQPLPGDSPALGRTDPSAQASQEDLQAMVQLIRYMHTYCLHRGKLPCTGRVSQLPAQQQPRQAGQTRPRSQPLPKPPGPSSPSWEGTWLKMSSAMSATLPPGHTCLCLLTRPRPKDNRLPPATRGSCGRGEGLTFTQEFRAQTQPAPHCGCR